MNKIFKFLLTGLLVASAVISPFAETTTTATIDPTKTGSITLYKLVSKDAQHVDGTGTEQDTSLVSDKALEGVLFSYIKIGDLEQVTAPEDEDDRTGLYYTLTSQFMDFVTSPEIGITPDATVIEGKNYYTADSINKLLRDINNIKARYGDDTDGSTSGNEVTNAWVKANGSHMPYTDATGRTSVNNLPLGLYLIAEIETPADIHDGVTQSVSKPSAPFMISLPMTNIATVDKNEPGTVWQYDVTAYPKNEMINIRKDIIADDNDAKDSVVDANGLTVTTDKTVGDYVNFLLTLDVPALQPIEGDTPNTNRKYVITDTMTKGLTLDSVGADNFVLTYGTNPWNGQGNQTLIHKDNSNVNQPADYFIEYNEQTNIFTITLTEAGLARFDQISKDCKLYVNYKARLNSLAADDTGDIKEEGNVTTLKYGTSVSTDRVFGSNPDVKVYTYELDITKSFSHKVEDKSSVTFSLQGELFDNQGNPTGKYEQVKFVKESEGIYHVYDEKELLPTDEKVQSVIAVSKNGLMTIKGLDARKYRLTEESTVPGYNLMRDVITISLVGYNPENGKLQSATVQSGSDKPINITDGLLTGQINIEIINNETITALHTGGEGWSSFMPLVGATIALVGGSIYFNVRRKEKK